ncbi:MAG: hypothetical protein M1816_006957 [Peltula sp. TS41687]|nr:MAG: hypothetical protein M1816_006957 [Peltula sp. TS41687]
MSNSVTNMQDASKMDHREMGPSSRFLMDAHRASSIIFTKNSFFERSRSSAIFNVDDQIAVQLLVETTVGDSPAFDVLSLEEIEELKRESARLLNHIDATERRLKLESKVHDAALSLSRLSSRRDKANTSDLLPPNASNSHTSHNGLPDQTNFELEVSSQRCEELAQELWRLERRLTHVQRRLLQHTAAVLQITRRATLANSDEHRSLAVQRPLSAAFPYGGLPSGGIMGSLNEHGISNGNDHLQGSKQVYYGGEGDRANPMSSELDRSLQAIRNTEQRLEYLNTRVRTLILEANPQQRELHGEPLPNRKASSSAYSDEYIQAQLEYLSNGLEVIQDQHTKNTGHLHKTKDEASERLSSLNKELHQIMTDCNMSSEQSGAVSPGSEVGLEKQFDYLKRGLETIKNELRSKARNPAHQEKAEQYETVITGLWDIIMSGEADARARARQGLPGSPDRSSDGGEVAVFEQFSLQAFSSKIQWLYGRVSGLEIEKHILRRQIQQQRELSNESDTAKDSVVTKLTEDLEITRKELEVANSEASNVRQEMVAVMQKLDAARKESTLREQQRANDDSTTMNEMAHKQEEIFRLEALIQGAQDSQDIIRAETQNQLREREQKIQSLEAELQASAQDKARSGTSEASLRQQISDMSQQLERDQVELKKLENEVVRLQTEATMARAELEGAYGSRAQRAAETGPDVVLQKEMDELARRNMSLLEEVAALKQQKPSGPTPDVGLEKEMDELARRNMSLLEEVAALKQEKPSGPNLGMQNEIAELARNNMSLLEEVAALQRQRPSDISNIKELQGRVDTLQKELAETIDEYEAMTKQSVEFEKEREQLENMVDSLRERCEAVEGQLNDEKLKWLGADGQGTVGKDGGPVESTSMGMLRSEFRKMMKDTRAENSRALKVEQEERRKLEAVVRAIRKEQSSAKPGAAS